MEYTVEEYNKKKELAESGNLDAICDLGYLYYYGFGNTAPDIDKGVYYWCTAANLGNAVAQDAMAWCYECGVGVEKNLFTAVDLKMKAANGGYSYAQFDVGNYFYYGYSEVNIEPNAEIAYSWYKKAADQNNGNAQLMVAYCLENGIGTDTNEDKSIEYYEKSASNGIAEAYLDLANIYSRKKMYDKSLELYKMAVDGKNYLAAVNISDYYCMVEESVDEAIKWINIAIDNNAIDKSTLPQLCNVGCLCYGEQKFEKAKHYFKKCLEYDANYIDALHMLGKCYLLGRGVSENIPLALDYFNRCVLLGDAESEYFVAECCLKGNIVLSPEFSDSKDEAFRHYYNAAEACADSGNKYLEGVSNLCMAELWLVGSKLSPYDENNNFDNTNISMADFKLQKAAECGNEYAMFELGHKYMSFDYDEARSYFESAKSIFIADGNQQKEEYIDSILELLSSSSQEANNYLHKLNWEWMNRRREQAFYNLGLSKE